MVSKGGGWWLEWMNSCGKEGIWVMVAAAKGGEKERWFSDFLERGRYLRLGCKGGIYRHLETLMKSD